MKKMTLKRTKNINRRALYTLRLSFTAAILVMAIFLCTSCGVSTQTESTESYTDRPTESVIDIEPTETEKSNIVILPEKETEPELDYDSTQYESYRLTEVKYPQMTQYPDRPSPTNPVYMQWRQDRAKQIEYGGAGAELDGFFQETIKQFLDGTEDGNAIYSPVNVYMTLALIAEVSPAEGRNQILELFGVESIEALRIQANAIWNANYFEDGTVTSVMANSVWMNAKSSTLEQSTLDILRDSYHTEAFSGDPTEDEYSVALRAWINENTGGLLNQVSGLEFSDDMLMSLASTMYFKARWENQFSESSTQMGIFHSSLGDIECDFMSRTRDDMYYYWGDKFTAVNKELEWSGGMWFILPDEGVTVEELIEDENALSFMTCNGEWPTKGKYYVNMTIPKFNIETKVDLKEKLEGLGITATGIDSASHGACVKIDEEGLEAAAYSLPMWTTGGPPDYSVVDFVVDRPFIFVVTGIDGLPLFVGVVNVPR